MVGQAEATVVNDNVNVLLPEWPLFYFILLCLLLLLLLPQSLLLT